MQVVIDIDENVFTRLFDNGIEDYAIVNDDLFAIAKSIRLCTPLPENATNGDVIKAMFPAYRIDEMSHTVWIGYDSMSFRKDWWNAPYKEEVEE